MTPVLAGAAMTAFGEHERGLAALLADAGAACLDDAAVAADAVEHCYVTESGGAYEHQAGLGPLVASDLGLDADHATAVEQTSAAGAAGVYAAVRAVRAGACESALVVGGDALTHRSTAVTTDAVSAVAHPAAYRHGVTIPAFAGLTARRYLERHDAPREALASVAVKNHRHGRANPKAHLREAVDEGAVLDSPVVADPLRLYDFCPISDGAAAVIVASDAWAREHDCAPVDVAGIAGATDTHVVHEREDLTRMRAVERAAADALGAADCSSADLEVCEVHDMFTILEPMQLEAIGVADPGEGWRLAPEGVTERGGALPVNPSGGLKAKGHPIGGSGVAQLVELYRQLLGRAGDRQVDADVALASNVGGFGNAAVVTVLEG